MSTLRVIPTKFGETDINGVELEAEYGFRVATDGELQTFVTIGGFTLFQEVLRKALENPDNLYAFLELNCAEVFGAFLETLDDNDDQVVLGKIATFNVVMDEKGYLFERVGE